MKTEDNRVLNITGTRQTPARAKQKCILSAGLIALGVYFWTRMETLDEVGIWWRVFAVVCFLVAAVLPRNENTYLDLTSLSIVTVKHYAAWESSQNSRPLSDFSKIVVRHLWRDGGGEGPDTYTGSVGLKPIDGSPVFWVKNFDATEEEVPSEAYAFAKKLEALTGLPMASGCELKPV